jgi:integrase
MSVRKRKWATKTGEARESWIVDYTDSKGSRHIETFARKKDADGRHDAVRVDVRKGVHTPVNKSATVEKAAHDWLKYVELEGREATTVEQYKAHANLHILPRIGREKLAALTAPRIEDFRDELLESMSRPLARKVLTSLKSIIKDAQRRGNVAQNVAAGVLIKKDKRTENVKLKIGVDIPTPQEVAAIINASTGRWKPLLITAAFTGLRASELRGLRWKDVNLKEERLHVQQRADRLNQIGRPKTAAGDREVPLRPVVVQALREWKLQCPRGDQDLVFANGGGGIENLSNILQRGFQPAQVAAGVTVPVKDEQGKPIRGEDGKPVLAAKYYGLHSLRHFNASWLINRKADGGLELPPKIVQERLGHSTIGMTMDTYGHLFPRGREDVEITELERALSLS